VVSPKVKLPDQNVLLLDIEWRPTSAYVWQAWKQNINPEAIIEHGGLLCVGAKWLGDKEIKLFSEWEHGHVGMLMGIHEMMSIADAIITYNGDKYDLPKLHGEFVLHGLPPAPPCTSIDVLKAVKKFGYFMNRLAFIGPFLGLGSKLEHEGMALWTKVINGDEDARKRMGKYCKQDVRVLEQLYLKVRPYIRNHPHLGKAGHSECPSCGGKHSHSRGTVRTRCYKKQRLQCQDCGHWYHGKQTKI
jgi:hypothetical protein